MNIEGTNWDERFVRRWARLYVDRYVKNREGAVQWGVKMFPDKLIPLIVDEAQLELRRRGIKLK
jgi:hypothetical protein